MALKIIYDNILEQEADVIVVPQFPQEGVLSELTTRIYNAAGYQDMTVAYNLAKIEAKTERDIEIKLLCHDGIPPSRFELPPLITVTPGFNLNAKHAVHVCVDATSWWEGQVNSERYEKEYILYQCYYAVLDHAYKRLGAKSIVIPLLGTSLLRFPEEFSRVTGERAIRNWLKENTPPLPPDCKQGDEEAIRRWKGLDSPMKIFLALPVSNGKAKPAPVDEKPAAAQPPHKTPEPYDDSSPLSKIIAKYDERFDKARAKKSGRKLQEYNNKICLEYLERIPNASKLVKSLGFSSSAFTRFKNLLEGLSNGNRLRPKKVIALAIGMELSDYERYEFIRCATTVYPYDEPLVLNVEEIIRSGVRSFKRINEMLCEIDPDFDLTKDKIEQKEKRSAKRIK